MSERNIMKSFVLQKKNLHLLTFSDWQEHIIQIQNLQNFKTSQHYSSIFKLIYFRYNDQLPSKIKNIFIQNESANPYNARRQR